MKKKILGVIAVLTIAAVAAFNMNLNLDSNKHSLSLINLEALAQNNSDGEKKDGFSIVECGSSTVIDPSGFVIVINSRHCDGDGTKECKCP